MANECARSIAAAAERMVDVPVGCLLVKQHTSPVHLLSSHRILQTLHRHLHATSATDTAWMLRPIGEACIGVWTRTVSVESTQTIAAAVDVLMRHRMDTVAVVNEHRQVVDVLSAADVVTAVLKAVANDGNVTLKDVFAQPITNVHRGAEQGAPVFCAMTDTCAVVMHKVTLPYFELQMTLICSCARTTAASACTRWTLMVGAAAW